MAITNKLVKFGYGYGELSSQAGMISFDASAQAIYVGDGTNANLVSSSVKNAVFENGVLTITYVDSTTPAVLNFNDVASAKQTMKIFETLERSINNLDTELGNLDEAYKAADKAINDKIGAVTEGKTLVGMIEEAAQAAQAAHTVVAKDSDFLTLNATTDASGAVTYTLGTNDVASAAELAEVKATADAAQTADEVSTAIDNKINVLGGSETGVDASGFVTVKVDTTAGQVSSVTVTGCDIASATELTRVAGRIDTFLDSENVEGVVDTLHEINNWISTSGKDVTDLTEAIAEEARLRDEADKALGLRIDGVKATADAAATKSEFDAYVSSNNSALAEVKATADAAAVKTEVESALTLKADKSQVATDISTAKSEAISAAAVDATTKANTAETNAKAYADNIKVNGQAQSDQEITVSGLNILVGGSGNHKDSSVNVAIEDLYSKVADASNAARVESLAVNAESSNYAEVNASTGAVTLTIKKVALAAATEFNTGVADAYDVKTSIATAKSEAISAVQGEEGDASTAATVAGAKAYADAKIESAALRWTVLS